MTVEFQVPFFIDCLVFGGNEGAIMNLAIVQIVGSAWPVGESLVGSAEEWLVTELGSCYYLVVFVKLLEEA